MTLVVDGSCMLGRTARSRRLRLPRPVRALWLLCAMSCQNEADDVLVEFPPPRLAALAPLEDPLDLQLEASPQEPNSIEVRLEGKRVKERLLYREVDATLELNPNDLHQLRGEIRVLLREPRFENDPPGVSPQLLARALGLLGDASARLGTRRTSPYAVFRIREVVESSARALSLAPLRTRGEQARRTVRLQVRGELELAGVRGELTVGLTIAALANSQSPDTYERFEVDCSSPVILSLKRYGIELWSADPRTADERPVRFTSARLGCRLVFAAR